MDDVAVNAHVPQSGSDSDGFVGYDPNLASGKAVHLHGEPHGRVQCPHSLLPQCRHYLAGAFVDLIDDCVLFQGVWYVVLYPQITMMVVALNLGLYLVVIRPRHLNPAAVGLMIAALAAVLAATAYEAVRFQVSWPPVVLGRRRWYFESVSVGVFGRGFLDFLSSRLSVPPDPTPTSQSAIVGRLGRLLHD